MSLSNSSSRRRRGSGPRRTPIQATAAQPGSTVPVPEDEAIFTGEPEAKDPELETSEFGRASNQGTPHLHRSTVSTLPGIGGVRTTLRETLATVREKAKEARRKRRHLTRDRFYWYEREWDSRFWARRLGISPRAILTLALVVVMSLFVFLIAARAAGRAGLPTHTSAERNADPIIIQQEGAGSGPIASFPMYTVGVWVSDMSPPAAGSIEVYTRVTQNAGNMVNEPVANVLVEISSANGVARASLPANTNRRASGGSARTNASGLATFTFFYGAVPGSPVYITATATLNGHQVSSNTVFVVA